MRTRHGRLLAGGTTMVFLSAAALAAAAVEYPDFSSTAGLKLNGSAAQAVDVLRLTPSAIDQTGSAFTGKRIVDPDKSLSTRFSFSLHDAGPGKASRRRGDGEPPPPPRGADGIAFVIQNGPADALGEGGGGLGYAGIRHSVAVEFDHWQNGERDDPSDNHVAVMKNGEAGEHLDSANPAFDLYGGTRFAWVRYSAGKERLKVYANDSNEKPQKPAASVALRLDRVLDGRSRAGFTAATGGSFEAADVLSWTLDQ